MNLWLRCFTKAINNKVINGSPIQSGGFTLPELLIASFLLSLFVASAASISSAILRSDVNLTQTIALRDNWNKIAQLINADIQEACSASVSGTTLTLRVLPSPESDTIPCSDSTAATITYSRSGTSLQRSGPRVRSDGTLSFQGVSSSGAFLDPLSQVLSQDVSAFTPSLPSGSTFYPTFTLTLTRGGLSYSGGPNASSASPDGRTRVRSFN